MLEVEFELRPDGLSVPIRYGELANTLGAEPNSRIDAARVRDAVLALRAGKGMVLDEADHDTWSVGSFFTNPVVDQEVFERLRGSVDGVVPNYPAPTASSWPRDGLSSVRASPRAFRATTLSRGCRPSMRWL